VTKIDDMMGVPIPASDMLATRELLLNRLLLEHLLACLDKDKFQEYLLQRNRVADIFDDLKMI